MQSLSACDRVLEALSNTSNRHMSNQHAFDEVDSTIGS